MFSKLLLVSNVIAVVVFAEPPVQYNQNQERFGSYSPSGWRPAGPTFSLPERAPVPASFYNSQYKNVHLGNQPASSNQQGAPIKQAVNFEGNGKLFAQVNPSYGAPEKTTRPETAYGAPDRSSQGNSDQSKVKIQPSVELSYGVPEEGSGSGNFQDQEEFKYHFLHPNFHFNQGNDLKPRNGIEYQVDLTYGAPQETLSAPPNQPAATYGPPVEQSTTEHEEQITTTEVPITTESSTDQEAEDNTEKTESNEENILEKENLTEGAAEQEQGIYYIYHPNGLLQRVRYSSKDDQGNMAFSAQLKYENVEPIRGPVYTYDPETYIFRRLY